MTVTQSLVDYYKSPTAAAAYANSDFVFLLRQKPESLAEIEMKGYLVMSPFEKRVYGSVTTFGGRYSEIAIKSPDGLAVGQLIVDKFSGKLMSTKAEDVHAIKMFEQQGFSKLEAIKKVALSATVFIIGLIIEKTFFEKEIIAVDLRLVMSKELEKTANQMLTQEQRDSRAKAFNKALEASLDHVSNNGRKIILVAPAVVNGVTDYTQTIIDEIPKLMDAREKRLAEEASK